MKILYYLTSNPSQFSFLYNIYQLHDGPIYFPNYSGKIPEYLNHNVKIFKNLDQVTEYNPDFILHTDFFPVLGGNWKNIYIGHGYGYDAFKNNCSDNLILSHDEYTKNGSGMWEYFDYIFVPSEIIKEEVSKEYDIDINKIRCIGYPRLDKIKKTYLINYNNKKKLLYAPSWSLKSSLLVMKDVVVELSKYFNVIVLFHSNTIYSPPEKVDAAKYIIKNKNKSLQIVYRNEYDILFDDVDDKDILNLNDDMNLLQSLIISTDVLLCDSKSGAGWDALFLETPYIKISAEKTLDLEDFIKKINNAKGRNKFNYCGKEYSVEDIFGKKDGKNSQRCINILNELLN